MAQDAAVGVLHAVGRVGSDAGSVVRDSAIGVIEGVGQVATATTTMLHDVVVGAIRGSSDAPGRNSGRRLNTRSRGRCEVERQWASLLRNRLPR